MSSGAERGKEEDELMRASRELLAGDRLGSISRRGVRSRPTMHEREEVEAARVKFRSPDDLAHRAGLLSDQVWDSYHLQYGDEGQDEHDRLSIKSEESENGSETGHAAGRHVSDLVPEFVDVTKLSAASRRSAAPHIYNIFEQIFIDSDAAHQRPAIPELPDAVRASMRASGINLEEELGLTGTRAEVVITIDESWHHLTGGTGIANRLSKQLIADLAIALRIDKSRIQVTSVRPDAAGARVVAEIILLPGADNEPAAVEVAEALSLQAGTPKSMLHAMTSTRRAGDVRFREVQPAVFKALRGGQQGPYQALLRGGVVVDDRGVRPQLSAVHGINSTQLKGQAAGQQERGGYNVRDALDAQQRQSQAMQMVEAARRHQEGFWVDVDRGVYQPVQTSKAYGTFHSPRAKKMPVWVWTTLVFGGTLLIALVCWLVYFKFYLAADDAGGPSAATSPPLDPAQTPTRAGAAPQPENHGNFADAAARAAVAAATRATAAAHKFFDIFGKRNASPAAQTPGVEPAPAADTQPAEDGAADAAAAEPAPEGGAPREEAGAA